MSTFIAGIGTALPPHRIAQADAAVMAGRFCCSDDQQRRVLAELYHRSGVATRHSVFLHRSDGPLEARQSFFHPTSTTEDRGPSIGERMRMYESAAGPLAGQAAEAALQDADVSPDRITHLVTVSCTGFSAPGFDFELIRELPLAPTVARTHIGFMGCHGALNGLRVARAFVQSDPTACVLLCAVELCSLHQYCGWETEKIVANSLFADGAAALVVTAEPPRDESAWQVIGSGSVLIPNSEDAMSWRISDHGFEMTLARCVPDLIREHLGQWLCSWLDQHGLATGQIGSWAIHPGGPRILSACGEAVALHNGELAESRRVLEEFGNMSSPTILFILERMRRLSFELPCVALGFGPGMVAEAALIV